MYYDANGIRIYNGDCLSVMPTLEANSVDAIVSDPPYGLSFMGKDWDHGVPGMHFWEEALRVAKPGAMLLAFGGTRTFHRLVCAIEDAGWEIRDEMIWMYGSGFPKSLDISKAIDKSAGADRDVVGQTPGARNGNGKNIDYGSFASAEHGMRNITVPSTDSAKQWSGWGTALKPAHEPISVARKPIEGTVAANVIKWGVGGINVDACRVGTEARYNPPACSAKDTFNCSPGSGETFKGQTVLGRWPSNILLSHSSDCVCTGTDDWSCVDDCPVRLLDEQSGVSSSPLTVSSGASRFFYTSKADRSDRRKSKHPTIKPLDLMRYLVRLVCPMGGIVLDPFMGSGSTIEAARHEHCKAIGIDLSEEYCADAVARLNQGMFDFTEVQA